MKGNDEMSEQKIKKEEIRKDNRQIKFRVSENEYLYLSALADQSGMSVPQFAKNVALGMKYHAPKVEREGAIQIANELRKHGVNLNQVAKACNSSQTLYKSDLEEIQKQLSSIEKGLIGLWERL